MHPATDVLFIPSLPSPDDGKKRRRRKSDYLPIMMFLFDEGSCLESASFAGLHLYVNLFRNELTYEYAVQLVKKR